MSEAHQMLFQRIRERCRSRSWYGADGHNPYEKLRMIRENDQRERERYEHEQQGYGPRLSLRSEHTFFWYDKDGKQYAINRDTDLGSFPLQTDFENPVVTQEQLDAAEQSLGFPLPALLKELYANVANGGFGPGYGIDSLENIVASYSGMKQRNRLVDIAFYERRQRSADHLEIPHYIWLDRFLYLCDWGCADYSYIDCVSERVFRGYAALDSYCLDLQAGSLYEWLDLWLQDKLEF